MRELGLARQSYSYLIGVTMNTQVSASWDNGALGLRNRCSGNLLFWSSSTMLKKGNAQKWIVIYRDMDGQRASDDITIYTFAHGMTIMFLFLSARRTLSEKYFSRTSIFNASRYSIRISCPKCSLLGDVYGSPKCARSFDWSHLQPPWTNQTHFVNIYARVFFGFAFPTDLALSAKFSVKKQINYIKLLMFKILFFYYTSP